MQLGWVASQNTAITKSSVWPQLLSFFPSSLSDDFQCVAVMDLKEFDSQTHHFPTKVILLTSKRNNYPELLPGVAADEGCPYLKINLISQVSRPVWDQFS
jgi:hypothetical protein